MEKQFPIIVVPMESGEKAVDYLKTHSVDLVILNMIMDPGIDALDTFRQSITIHPRQRAIIISGHSETERIQEALKLGVGAYLRKPFMIEKIGQVIRAALDKNKCWKIKGTQRYLD